MFVDIYQYMIIFCLDEIEFMATVFYQASTSIG